MDTIKKRILLLSTGDVNGAYEYLYKLSQLLFNDGHQVVLLVKSKSKSDNFVIQFQNRIKSKKTPILYRIIRKIVRRFRAQFAERAHNFIQCEGKYFFLSLDETKPNIAPTEIIDQIGFVPEFVFSGMTVDFINSTDLYNLFLETKAQIFNIPVDMNCFTGGCHYAWNCEGYIDGCQTNCPAIINDSLKSRAKINFETKLANKEKGNFKILTGSGWTLKQAKESKIYRNQKLFYNINSLIDTRVFNHESRDFAKRIFNLDENCFYILMGCQSINDSRKGFEYLIESLTILDAKCTPIEKERIRVVLVSRHLTNNYKDIIPFETTFIEYVNDYRLLSLLYQAVDVFVNSSIEDSGPMMVSEALACGTPVVGFDMGIVNNMVVNNFNGYKAKLRDSVDLAIGIITIFNLDKNEFEQYSKNASSQVEKFSSYASAKDTLNELLQNK